MNFRMIFNNIGKILLIEAALLFFPLLVSLIYKETNQYAYLITIGALLCVGVLLCLIRPKTTKIYAREGFILVGLSWIVMSLFGSLPFVISQEIPSFVDALFETISGFTTTGASILTNVEGLSKSMLFWRSFTHWIGGMGVLVFILAILPNSEGQNIYILRAESTGPQVGKLVSKVRFTARILYLIYLGLTLLEVIFLLFGGNSFYDSLVTSLATAGTGGFGIYNDSIMSFNSYSQIVIGVFMLIFGINFNIFYLILIGRIAQAFKSEELRWYVGVIVFSTIAIAINLTLSMEYAFHIALKDSFFQVSSIITTTGFATADFNLWPNLSKYILLILMFVGACAGSTGGGMKVSRFVILFKSLKREIKKLVHPNSVSNITFEGSTVDENVVKGVNGYFGIMMCIIFASLIVLSFDKLDFETNFTAIIACVNNIGPGFSLVGPMGNYSCFNDFSKIILSALMLIGRLEIYPILLLFMPKVWFNK